jgi:hypothetical protein
MRRTHHIFAALACVLSPISMSAHGAGNSEECWKKFLPKITECFGKEGDAEAVCSGVALDTYCACMEYTPEKCEGLVKVIERIKRKAAQIKQATAADLTRDGSIDETDLAVLLDSWGQDARGDINVDGITDGADLDILLDHFGMSTDAIDSQPLVGEDELDARDVGVIAADEDAVVVEAAEVSTLLAAPPVRVYKDARHGTVVITPKDGERITVTFYDGTGAPLARVSVNGGASVAVPNGTAWVKLASNIAPTEVLRWW